jgi:Protein of unknown function (DUF1403)
METYRTSIHNDKRGGFLATKRDKAPPGAHHTQVIRADLAPSSDPLADPTGDPDATAPAGPARGARAKQNASNPLAQHPFPPPPALPSWARANGRAGEDPLFFAGVSLALFDAFLRRDPPCAGALRSRLALTSAAASAKILRLNTHEGALRDLRFAVGDAGPAARLLQLWRELAGRPPGLDPNRIRDAAAALDLPAPNGDGLAAGLRACVRGEDPVSAAANAAAMAFGAFPDAPAAEVEVLALWVFDLALALRLRWPRPAPLIATKILDPGLRSDGGRRPKPGDPAWPKAAAGAIALAAASALDLAADLSRRADTLIAVAPKLRAKPAAKIVDLLLAEDCVSVSEGARHAPMTDRAARRLFDRLVRLSAARELTGRPAFRLYGL